MIGRSKRWRNSNRLKHVFIQQARQGGKTERLRKQMEDQTPTIAAPAATAPVTTELETDLTADAPAIINAGEFTPAAIVTNPAIFEHIQRVAKMYAASQWVPDHYRGKVADCSIAIGMAASIGVNPMVFLQNTYPVHGKIGFEGKLAIALVNVKGGFKHNLRFDVQGEGDDLKVTAWTLTRDDTEVMVTASYAYKTAKNTEVFEKGKTIKLSEKSSWKGDIEQKCCYMAALKFIRRHCPELLMGMQMAEELEMIRDRDVTYTATLDARSR